MSAGSAIVVAVLLASAGWAVWDIVRSEQATIVLYTTPALRDVLERELIPAFEEQSNYRVAAVYVAAGQQFNRLHMSGDSPEADLFLHASPLYLEKGYEEGFVEPVRLEVDDAIAAPYKSREIQGGRIWYAFGWSPLVSVYPAGRENPDLATVEAQFGFPHPRLSNNGVYAVAFLDAVSPAAGEHLLGQTRVQPTNARATIGGVADGNLELTLGYEAVARFFQGQGASIDYDAPLVAGERATMRVVFSAALIRGEDRHLGAEEFLRYLFSPDAQGRLAAQHIRPVLDGAQGVDGALDVSAVRTIDVDWSTWHAIEQALPRYEVKG
jgi:ABC-type Fe3+ transport system substrate-binding protein